MTEKELRNLSRRALLELLIAQTERADALRKRLDECEKQLNDRRIAEGEAGSIAEAALKLNGVFEAAEAAAAQYLENIKNVSENQAQICEEIEEESRARARRIIADAERKCMERELLCEQRLSEISAEMRRLYGEKRALDRLYKEPAVKKEDEE